MAECRTDISARPTPHQKVAEYEPPAEWYGDRVPQHLPPPRRLGEPISEKPRHDETRANGEGKEPGVLGKKRVMKKTLPHPGRVREREEPEHAQKKRSDDIDDPKTRHPCEDSIEQSQEPP